MKKNTLSKTTLALRLFFLSILFIALSFFLPQKTKSAPPSSVRDTLSTSQLSYFGRLASGVTTGDSIVRVGTTYPSNTTNNLFIGDTIAIGTTGAGVGNSGPLTIYTIAGIGDTMTMQLNSGIGQSNAFAGAAVIATRSAIHTISFTPQSNSTGGFWEFLIKASNRVGETSNDGIPDQEGFDLGATTPSSGADGLGTRLKLTDVTCPNWGTGTTTAYSIGTTTIGTNLYHVVTCYLGVGGTNQIGTSYTAVIGKDLSTGSQLINPSPQTNSHTEGTADVYTFYIRHKDSSNTLISNDTFQGKIAVVESVRVTATIDPTLTFFIDSVGVGNGATRCGNALGAAAANTTATAVQYGSISLGQANDLAQRLSCVTNGTGYVVTVYEANQMKSNTGTTIPDTVCDGGCTSDLPAAWTSFSNSGWGYSLENVNVGVTIFNYTQGYKAFGAGPSNAKEIMKNTAKPTTTEQAYVCYRLTASTIQEAGNYENKLIYTATATF